MLFEMSKYLLSAKHKPKVYVQNDHQIKRSYKKEIQGQKNFEIWAHFKLLIQVLNVPVILWQGLMCP